MPASHVAVAAHRDVARQADALGEDLSIEPFRHADPGILIHGRILAEREPVRLAIRRAAAECERARRHARPKHAPAHLTAPLSGHGASPLPIAAHGPSAVSLASVGNAAPAPRG
jgi:hypothetical protein